MKTTPSRLLATDLDGTFLPLDDDDSYRVALQTIATAIDSLSRVGLIYVTGRHLASVEEAMEAYSLPPPDGIFCDVGTTFYERVDGDWISSPPYRAHMAACAAGVERSAIETLFHKRRDLRLQEPEKQERFKVSYYCPSDRVRPLVGQMTDQLAQAHIPYSIIGSVDPFTHTGLVDVLPAGASKASALDWLIQETGLLRSDLVFAGDSGNDVAVFISGIPSIVVGNAKPEVIEDVKRALGGGAPGTVYFSRAPATCGVLEGCRHYGLL
jgi:HAD superfamily hydrolase (TIGR01484 family)